jgi:hypothetical protein
MIETNFKQTIQSESSSMIFSESLDSIASNASIDDSKIAVVEYE